MTSDVPAPLPLSVDIARPAPRATDAFEAIDLGEISAGAAYHYMCAVVVPRPIAFVTTITQPGGHVNAAPFSYFNGVTAKPPTLSIAIGRRAGAERKDTARNIAESGEFVVNVCSVAMARAISVASGDFAPDVSEVDLTQLELLPSTRVRPPRVANTAVQLECELDRIVEVGDGPACDLVLGRIVMAHIDRAVLDDNGRVNVARLDPLARLAGLTYAKVHDAFDVPRGLPE